MAKRVKTPYEEGYEAGLDGATEKSNSYEHEGAAEQWESGRQAGIKRKAEHDAEDEAPQAVTAPVELNIAAAKSIVKDHLAYAIEADGFEVARAVELWLRDYMTPGKMSDGPVPYGIEPDMIAKSPEDAEAYGLRFARGLNEYLKKV